MFKKNGQSTQLVVSCSKTTLFTPYPKSLGGKPRSEVDGGFGQPAFHQRSTSGHRVEILLCIPHCVAAGNLKTLMINHLGNEVRSPTPNDIFGGHLVNVVN